MIRLTSDPCAILAGTAMEPIQGSLIETLWRAYGDLPGRIGFYRTDSGAVLSRQGGELTLAGRAADPDELIAFARMTGATRLNALAVSVKERVPGDARIERRQALVYPRTSCPPPHWRADDDPNTRRVFEIVKTGSAPAFDHASEEAFITDIGWRRRLGLAQVYTVADAATAGIYTTGATHALIACVATLPHARGRGYARAAVSACVRYCLDIGRIPALVAETDDVVGFYINMGFVPYGENLTFVLGEQ